MKKKRTTSLQSYIIALIHMLEPLMMIHLKLELEVDKTIISFFRKQEVPLTPGLK